MLQLRVADENSKKWFEVMRANAERGASMVRQVLSFARGVEGERVALQPKHLIKEIVKILRETLPKSIEINFQVPNDLWIISADATQIHQVLMNLCVNARDAMPEGGSISIKAENVFLDKNYARMHIEAKAGRFVVISVSDTGPGMTAEIQSRIFEPFFTTKEMTKGTGLGLSTALTIVMEASSTSTASCIKGVTLLFTFLHSICLAHSMQPPRKRIFRLAMAS
jgi:signal transduction histidine kinase